MTIFLYFRVPNCPPPATQCTHPTDVHMTSYKIRRNSVDTTHSTLTISTMNTMKLALALVLFATVSVQHGEARLVFIKIKFAVFHV
jgi:hypothetical protein